MSCDFCIKNQIRQGAQDHADSGARSSSVWGTVSAFDSATTPENQCRCAAIIARDHAEAVREDQQHRDQMGAQRRLNLEVAKIQHTLQNGYQDLCERVKAGTATVDQRQRHGQVVKYLQQVRERTERSRQQDEAVQCRALEKARLVRQSRLQARRLSQSQRRAAETDQMRQARLGRQRATAARRRLYTRQERMQELRR